MLGDVPIFGNFPCKVVENNRIILPSSSKAEKDDNVVFCISDIGNDAIDIYPLAEFDKLVRKSDDVIFSSNSETVVERAKNEKRRLCGSAIYQAGVDGQRRLTLNPIIFEILGSNTAKLYGLGEMNRIKFFASVEKFSDYTGHTYIKRV